MIRIGNLQVDFSQRCIERDGEILRVGSRALDILEILSNANGEIVSKDELMRRVWPRAVVEENNLQVHIATLRKMLRDDRQLISTVHGRGYRLLRGAHARDNARARAVLPTEAIAAPASNASQAALPAADGELCGRDAALQELLPLLQRSRLLTLTGAGGIGKTRLAIEVARKVAAQYPDGVIFVPLSQVTEPCFALDVLATALNLKASPAPMSLHSILDGLRGRRSLIVLDNCEHVKHVASELAVALCACGSTVLATSREALRVADEMVYVVPPLDVPAITATEQGVLLAGAVRLFMTRLRAQEPGYRPDEVSILRAGAICRALDGIPLAIELAAARAATLGIDVLCEHLGDRLRILTGGCPTALPRHQTMNATLDWSYRLLTQVERRILRCLGVFVGGFTYDAVEYLAAADGLSEREAKDALHGLLNKSMISQHLSGDWHRFRLLETTREYALQKLEDNGELRFATGLQARFLFQTFDRQSIRRRAEADTKSLAEFSAELANIRAALDWALSPAGDVALGVALASVVVRYLLKLSQPAECCLIARQALAASERAAPESIRAEALMMLQAAYAAGLVYTSGPGQVTRQACTQAYADAMCAGNIECELSALWGLWKTHQYSGECRDALRVARHFNDAARRAKDSRRLLLGMRMEGVVLHYLGDQSAARAMLERMLPEFDSGVDQVLGSGLHVGCDIAARASLARVLWLQGEAEQALHLAQSMLNAAMAGGNELVLCYVLAEAVIPLALLSEDAEQTIRATRLLKETASRMSFQIWVAASACFEQCIVAMATRAEAKLHEFASAIAQLKAIGFLAPLTLVMGRFAQALINTGRLNHAMAVVNEALGHCEVTGERWFYAELSRIKASILLQLRSGDTAAQWLTEALNTSREQGAAMFERRATIALARWLLVTERAEEASALLSALDQRLPGHAFRLPLARVEADRMQIDSAWFGSQDFYGEHAA